MGSVTLGVLASLLSAATASIVAHTDAHVHPLWLLLSQYVVGAAMAPIRRAPTAPLRLHVLRLAAGLWAFGGYYAALGSPGVRPSAISMVLNVAPVAATFVAASSRGARVGTLMAFVGVAATLRGDAGTATIAAPHLLALSAAAAYTVSILLLGHLAEAGEHPSTTNSLYNAAGSLFVGAALLTARPAAPASWLPVLLIGVIAALRIQVLTVAAVNPAESARVSVLSNLAFVWLAIGEAAMGGHGSTHWAAMALVVAGTSLANAGCFARSPRDNSRRGKAWATGDVAALSRSDVSVEPRQ